MLEVRRPGLLTTVQDGLGRPDAASLGVPRGGAADPASLAIANLLLGNDMSAAGLEITLDGPELVAVAATSVALAGADLGATIDGRPFEAGSARRLSPGQALDFTGLRAGRGIRAYLALPGGLDVPIVLGSASTCLVGGFGGLDGRALRTGDRVAGRRRASILGTATGPAPGPTQASDAPVRVRITAGPHETDRLTDLCNADWTVSPTSSRAGLRLVGPSLARGHALTSLPVTWGTVQLPPGGEPIVLLVDGPTVGGYPVVAVVASVDRPTIGQLGPGDRVRFEVVDEATARALELDRRRALAEWAARIERDTPWDDLDHDAGAWPAAGGVDS
jgi:biotin-dependent carboxylase-like uncharacterized protein